MKYVVHQFQNLNMAFLGDVKTVETLDRGRGVRCATDVKKGTTLLREECIACVLCSDVRGSYCDHCLLPGYNNLMRCSGCKFARYCNRKCQKNAWIDHKQECKGLQRVAPNIPTDTVRLLARIMWRSKRSPKPTVDIDDKNFPLTVEQLQGDVDKMVEQRRADMGAVFFVLQKFLDGNLLGYTTAQILRLFVIVEINGFHLFDQELKNIGYALYQRASMVNHHCEPNCLVIFDGPILEVRTLQDLKEGDELLITYIELLVTTETRRAMLMDQFRFHCMCSKCEDPFSDQILKCVACPAQKCKGLLKKIHPDKDAKCTSCKGNHPSQGVLWEDSISAEEKAESLLESANDFRKKGDWMNMLSRAEECLSLPVLHRCHFSKLRARNVAMDAHIELQNWNEALRYGEENLESYNHQYQFIHPSVGIQLMRVGKLYNYLGKVEEALKMFQQAHKIISVTHAPKHALYQALVELLRDCEMELRGIHRLPLEQPEVT